MKSIAIFAIVCLSCTLAVVIPRSNDRPTCKDYINCQNLNCPYEVPKWDTKSDTCNNKFNAIFDEEGDCKEARNKFNGTPETDPVPEEYAKCFEDYTDDDMTGTFFEKFILNCHKSCFKDAQPPKPEEFSFKNLKETTDCQAGVESCGEDDEDCKNDKTAYETAKTEQLTQCEIAISYVESLKEEDDYPYGMYACEMSAEPNPKDEKDGETFHKIWENLQACYKSEPTVDFPKEKYITTKALNCPTKIPEWDTDSTTVKAEYDAYIKDGETCIAGMKQYEDTDPKAALPEKYVECISKFTPKKDESKNTYFYKYIYNCDKTIVDTQKDPVPETEKKLIIDYKTCITGAGKCADEDTICQASKTAYDNNKKAYDQCVAATTAYKDLDEKTQKFPYYMDTCEHSVEPSKTGEGEDGEEEANKFHDIWAKQIKCQENQEVDFSKKQYEDLKNLYCPSKIPVWDKESINAQTEYDQYLETDVDCEEGIKQFDLAGEDDALPEQYVKCITSYKTGDELTYFYKYIFKCDKTIIETQEAPKPQKEKKLKSEYEECIKGAGKCEKDDTICNESSKAYEKNKTEYPQCINAIKKYTDLEETQKFPYYMDACEHSVEPSKTGEGEDGEEANLFHIIWNNKIKCQEDQEVEFTKKEYLEMKALNCPVIIPKWDTISIAAQREYDEYKKSDVNCVEGQTAFDEAKDEDGLPEQYVQCITSYTTEDKNSYFYKYIYKCDRTIADEHKAPEPEREKVSKKSYDSCTGKAKSCPDYDSKCQEAKKAYDKSKTDSEQCQLAKAKYEKLGEDDKYPYYMDACEQSLKPSENDSGKFYSIWQSYIHCQEGLNKLKYELCYALNCPNIVPAWDEESTTTKTKFEDYKKTDEICKAGVEELDKAQPTDQVPDKYKTCLDSYTEEKKDNYYWKFNIECHKTCMNTGEHPDITDFEFNMKQQEEKCREDYLDCDAKDKECQKARQTHQKAIAEGSKQCQEAVEEYIETPSALNYPYSMYACELSIKPNPKETNFFNDIYNNSMFCLKKKQTTVTVTKFDYEECMKYNCPVDIPAWATDSKDIYTKWLEYEEKTQDCLDGKSELNKALDVDAIPDKWKTCVNGFEIGEEKTYYKEYIYKCTQQCMNTGKPPVPEKKFLPIAHMELCQAGSTCKDDDEDCIAQQKDYEGKKELGSEVKQCNYAGIKYRQAEKSDEDIYYLFACDHSLEPETDKHKSFHEVWEGKIKCFNPTKPTVKQYKECKAVNCPDVTPFNDAQSKEQYTKYKEHWDGNAKCEAAHDILIDDEKQDEEVPNELEECLNAVEQKTAPFFKEYIYDCDVKCAESGQPPIIDKEFATYDSYTKCLPTVSQNCNEEIGCVTEEKAYNEAKGKEEGQCSKAEEQAKKEGKFNYGLYACFQSLENKPTAEKPYYTKFHYMWQSHIYCGLKRKDTGIKIFQQDQCNFLNCLSKYPKWDEDSQEVVKQWNTYYAKNEKCREYAKLVKNLDINEVIPTSGKECTDGFTVDKKYQSSIYWTVQRECSKACSTTAKPPSKPAFQKISSYTKCASGKKCNPKDDKCEVAKDIHDGELDKLELCLHAQYHVKALGNDKAVPYSLYSCERTLEPEKDGETTKTFHKVWAEWVECMKKKSTPTNGSILTYVFTFLFGALFLALL